MKCQEFVSCFRKTDNSKEIADLLAKLGVKKAPRIPKDDTDARVDLESQGMTLIFLPAGPQTSELVLVAVQFFSDEAEDYSTYEGELPHGLEFTDDQEAVKNKLGKPDRAKEFLAREFWDIDGLVLTVKYSKLSGLIAMVSLHAPEYY